MYKYKYMSMYLCIFVLKNFYSSIHFIYLFFSKIKMQKNFHNNRINKFFI